MSDLKFLIDPDGSASAPATTAESSSSSSSLSLSQRASGIWGKVTSTVAQDTAQLKKHLFGSSSPDVKKRYNKPICLDGADCKLSINRDHMNTYRHLCPYRHNCNSCGDWEHLANFYHDPQWCDFVYYCPGEKNDELPVFNPPCENDDDDDDDNNENDGDEGSNKKKKKKKKNTNNKKDEGLSFLDEVVSIGKKMTQQGSSKTSKDFPTKEEILAKGISGTAPLRASYGNREFKLLSFVQATQWSERSMAEAKQADMVDRGQLNKLPNNYQYNGERVAHSNDGDDETSAAVNEWRDRISGKQPSQQQEQQQTGVPATKKVSDFFSNLFSSSSSKKDQSESNSNSGGGAGEESHMLAHE